jgi:hypothetical protein
MDPKTFQSKAAGQLVKVGQGQASDWALSSNPLSPEIRPETKALMTASSSPVKFLRRLSGNHQKMTELYFYRKKYNFKASNCTYQQNEVTHA